MITKYSPTNIDSFLGVSIQDPYGQLIDVFQNQLYAKASVLEIF